jgi:hypothetical protein
MAYTETWSEIQPGGSEARSLGDDRIREFKRAIRERLAADHNFKATEAGDDTIGYHIATHLLDNVSDPTPVAGTGIIFSKTVDGVIELCYSDEDGLVKQITTKGKLNVAADEAVLLTGAQTVAGVKTLSDIPVFSVGINNNNQQAVGLCVENRTNDTGCTQTGRLWLRTDI